MQLINNNPYRIAGILSNASSKELQKQKGKVKAFSKVGKVITSEFDFDILGELERTEEIIEKAFANIEQSKDKVKNALFWFIKVSAFDETAISYLKNGDDEKALEIWGRITNDKEVNSKNFSAFNNIGTLKLLRDSEQIIKEGIAAKIKLIDSNYFVNFAQIVADETFTIDKNSQSEILIDELLTEFNKHHSSIDTFNLFSNCNGTTHKYLSKRLTDTPIHNIEVFIESTKRKRQANKSEAYNYGVEIARKTKDDLILLKALLGKNDLKFKMIADGLAKEIMQCGIDYFQEWKDTKDPSKEGIKMLKYAKSIAIGTQTKDRIKENIDGIKEWAETEPIKEDLAFITNKLKSFQNLNDTISNAKTLITSCKGRLQNIKNILGVNDELYLNVSSAVVSNALGMVIEVVNEAQSGLEHNRAKLLRLPNIVSDAVYTITAMSALDMNSQTRQRFSENKSAINGINRELDAFRRQTIKSTRTSSSSSYQSGSTSSTSSTTSSNQNSWAGDNPGCLVSIICLVIGAILLSNDVGFGGVLIFIGLFAHRFDD